ncbi:unnamed protein product [Cochlearia groenlandica]
MGEVNKGESVCRDPKVDIRVGDEYQADIPLIMSESKRATLLLNPLTLDLNSVVGLPVELVWIDTNYDNVDETPGSKQKMNLKAIPEKPSSSWGDLEVDAFVLGLYTFGKNFTQVKKLLGIKECGDVLSFYYGKFYKSDKHKVWSSFLKKRSTKCIQGKKLYSGWRLQQLLSRLIPSITDETQKHKLVKVSKSFAEDNTSLESYITAVKELVGLRSLVEAVAIGKDKQDLTVLAAEPLKAKQWFTVSSAVADGLGAYTSLTSDEIIEKLTGGPRLSKARCIDLFWEAVWPRLLASGWHSEQPKDRSHIKSRDELVFLIPGVKKFSRRKLVKQNHYYDSISDILTKVVSEPELLEFETEEIRAPSGGLIEDNICNNSNKEKRCYLRLPDSSSTRVKFTVVDSTSLASGRKLCEFRELKNPGSLVSQSKACRGHNNSSAERFADECKWESRRMKKLVDDPMRFLIVDTSVDHGGHSSGLRRQRRLPGDEIRRDQAFGGSSHKQVGNNTCVDREYPNGTDSGVKDEALEDGQQGLSKKRSARKSESNSHHLVSPLPKRRRPIPCVRKDLKRCGERSVLKLPVEQSEETEPNGLCPVSDTGHESSPLTQQLEPNGLCSISVLDIQCASKKQGEFHEHSSFGQQQEESNRPCTDEKCSSKNLKTAQQQEKSIQLPDSDKNPPYATQEAAPLEQEEEAQNEETNTGLPRRQSTRKRPLTTRALEALESEFYRAKSMKSTPKTSKRERSARIKNSANASNITQGLVQEDTEDLEPNFLVNEASKPADQTEGSEKVTTKLPKRPPIVLKLPFKRG